MILYIGLVQEAYFGHAGIFGHYLLLPLIAMRNMKKMSNSGYFTFGYHPPHMSSQDSVSSVTSARGDFPNGR